MHSFDLVSGDEIAAMEREFRRTFVNGLSGFKSLNLAGTVSATGQTNLAIMNSAMHVGADPPLMGLLIRPAVTPRHTLQNLLETGFFTLNHVTEALYAQAHQTSARYPEEVSEFEAVGLTPCYSQRHPAPYVAESPLRIGLAFREQHLIRANDTILVIGQIVEVQVASGAIGADGFVDLEKTGTLAGSGLDGYYRAERVGRLGYARV